MRLVVIPPLLRVLLLSSGLRYTTLGLVSVLYRLFEQVRCVACMYAYA
jgi:hypothetical protein